MELKKLAAVAALGTALATGASALAAGLPSSSMATPRQTPAEATPRVGTPAIGTPRVGTPAEFVGVGVAGLALPAGASAQIAGPARMQQGTPGQTPALYKWASVPSLYVPSQSVPAVAVPAQHVPSIQVPAGAQLGPSGAYGSAAEGPASATASAHVG